MKKLRFAITGIIVCSVIFLTTQMSSAEKNTDRERRHGEKEGREERESEARNEALDGLQSMNRMRAYPNNDIPANAYASAMQQFNARFGNPTVAAGTWTSIGPNNIGGRTLCVAIDPTDTNEVWLGSAGGGLWKSTVGGFGPSAWTYVPTGFPIIGVSTIAINPSNADEMYIGTGETYNLGSYGIGLTDRTTRGSYGMGILKSLDGGVTWTQALNWSYQQQDCIWDIVINPLRPQTVFAATTDGVYKSTDAGTTWNQVLNIPVCMDLALHETDTTVIMCGAGDMNSANKGLYRSVDGGLNWTLVTGLPTASNDGRTTISLYPGNNDIGIVQVCNAFNTIGFYKTTDKGATWTLSTAAYDICGYQGWYCAGMAFHPNNPNDILVGGIDMHRSSDGGSNFTQVSNMNWGPQYMHSDLHHIVVNPQNPNSIFVATDGGLFRSFDFGNTYTECVDGYVTAQCYIGSVSQTDPDFVLTGLQDNFSLRYYGTPYWNPVLGGDGCYNAIDPADDFVSYVAYQYLNVFQSTDQGFSYNQVTSGGSQAAFLAPFVICPSNSSVLYAGKKALARSNDQGATWPTVSVNPIDNGNYILSIGVSAHYEDSVYIATAPDFSPMKLMLSTDGGSIFVNRSAGLPNRFPRRIAVDPRNSQIVYVVFSGFGTGHIFKSTNAGVTWTDIGTSLPDVPFHCVMMDPMFPDVVYAGTDMGLYVSTDAGATWTTHNTGLPDWTMVYDLISCAADRSFLCFTHGHGAFRRSLNDVVSGVANPPAPTPFSLSVFPNPVNEMATLVFGETYGPVQVTIHDLEGKLVFSKELAVNPASPYLRVDVGEWANGIYIAKAVNGDRVGTSRILVTK